MKWLTLWRNREIAYELFNWFRDIVRKAVDLSEALRRLSESVHRGDLDDLVKKTQDVAQRRSDYLDS